MGDYFHARTQKDRIAAIIAVTLYALIIVIGAFTIIYPPVTPFYFAIVLILIPLTIWLTGNICDNNPKVRKALEQMVKKGTDYFELNILVYFLIFPAFLINEFVNPSFDGSKLASPSQHSIGAVAGSNPKIANLVDLIFYNCIENNVSKLEIHPVYGKVLMQCFDKNGTKMPGVFENDEIYSPKLHVQVATRIKFLAGMKMFYNIGDRGRIELNHLGRKVTMQVQSYRGSGEIFDIKFFDIYSEEKPKL